MWEVSQKPQLILTFDEMDNIVKMLPDIEHSLSKTDLVSLFFKFLRQQMVTMTALNLFYTGKQILFAGRLDTSSQLK